jgi:hypothetical protein
VTMSCVIGVGGGARPTSGRKLLSKTVRKHKVDVAALIHQMPREAIARSEMVA